MSVYVEINGVQQRGLSGVAITAVRVSQSLANRNTADLTLVVEGGATNYLEGQQVDIGNGAARFFSGTIATVSARWLNPKTTPPAFIEYTLGCVSYDQIASRRIVTLPQVYTGQTAGAIVRDIATQFLGGENITVTHVEDGPTFESFSVEAGANVYEVLDSVAERAAMYWDILGSISVKDLRLYSRGSLASGWSLDDSSPIVYGGPGGESGIRVETVREGMANEVYVELADGPGPPTSQDFLGDGSTRDFSVDKPIDSQPVIKVNGVPKAVALKDYITADWYWTSGSATVEQDLSQPILSGSDLLSVEYVPRERIVVLGAQDSAAIAGRAALEATSGRYQIVITAADGSTITTASQAAAAYLAAHKAAAKRLTVRSFADQAEALGIGQTLPVTLDALSVSGTFLVESVVRSWEGRFASDGLDAILHTFTLSSGAVLGDWITAFAGAWSVGGGGSAQGGGVISGGSGSRSSVQSLGVLTADVTITPDPAGPAAGDMLLVLFEFGTAIYTVSWDAAFVGLAEAVIAARQNTKHAFLFVFDGTNWSLITWRTALS